MSLSLSWRGNPKAGGCLIGRCPSVTLRLIFCEQTGAQARAVIFNKLSHERKAAAQTVPSYKYLKSVKVDRLTMTLPAETSLRTQTSGICDTVFGLLPYLQPVTAL
jgi:hypothetical protein